jgi:hypothetical protein
MEIAQLYKRHTSLLIYSVAKKKEKYNQCYFTFQCHARKGNIYSVLC